MKGSVKKDNTETLLTVEEKLLARKDLVYTIWMAGDIIPCPRSFYQKNGHEMRALKECKHQYLQQTKQKPSRTPLFST